MEIQVMVKRPNKDVEIICIENEVEVIEEILEGYIEFVPINKLSDRSIDMIVNIEGKINGLDINLAFANENGIVDVVNGTTVFLSFEETIDDIKRKSLNDSQIEYIKSLLNSNIAINLNGNIIPVIEL